MDHIAEEISISDNSVREIVLAQCSGVYLAPYLSSETWAAVGGSVRLRPLSNGLPTLKLESGHHSGKLCILAESRHHWRRAEPARVAYRRRSVLVSPSEPLRRASAPSQHQRYLLSVQARGPTPFPSARCHEHSGALQEVPRRSNLPS